MDWKESLSGLEVLTVVATLQELIQLVRDEVQDPNKERWSDTVITKYLNDGQLSLAQFSRALTVWQIPVDAHITDLPRPTDLLIPKYAHFEVNSNRFLVDIKHGMVPDKSSGFPEALYIISSSFYLYPVPTTSGTLYLTGVARPAEMVNPTDIPSVEDADSLLVVYAAWMCLLSDGDPNASSKGVYYREKRAEWLVLDALKYPTPTFVERRW